MAPDLRGLIASRLQNPDLSQQLSEMRSYLLPGVKILGTMNDQSVYQTYLECIRGAQSEICLPMLATSPNLSSVPLLRERASKGVKVRILQGSPVVTGKLRGATMVATSKDSIRGWIRNAENHPQIQIRISSSSDDMQAATCMLVDGRLLKRILQGAETDAGRRISSIKRAVFPDPETKTLTGRRVAVPSYCRAFRSNSSCAMANPWSSTLLNPSLVPNEQPEPNSFLRSPNTMRPRDLRSRQAQAPAQSTSENLPNKLSHIGS